MNITKEHLAVVTVEEWSQLSSVKDVYCKGQGFLQKLKNLRSVYILAWAA